MTNPKLTVIIPVFNASKTLERAINSVLSQDFKDFELLVINDGSTDDSIDICKSFLEKYSCMKIFDIPNGGVGNARNIGLRNASGKFVTFLDSDDYYESNALQMIENMLEKDTELLTFNYFIEYPNGRRKKKNKLINARYYEQEPLRKYLVKLVPNFMLNPPWNKVYSRDYLIKNNILFPTDIDIGEDLKFNLSVVKDISRAIISEYPLVHYTFDNRQGLSSKFRLKRFDIRNGIYNDLKEILKYWNILNDNESMCDSMLLKDVMAFFADFYKESCTLTLKEKTRLVNEILDKSDVKDILKYEKNLNPTAKTIKQILKTKNFKIIISFAKLISFRRGVINRF